MIDFVLRYTKESPYERESILKLNGIEFESIFSSSSSSLYLADTTRHLKLNYKTRTLIAIGDMIAQEEKENIFNQNAEEIIQCHPGFYYLLEFQKESLRVFNSLFGILPVYHSEKEGQVLVSSRAGLIRDYLGQRVRLNKQWVLERILFNHGLDTDTPCREIRLLPAHHNLIIKDGKVTVQKYLAIENYFTGHPRPWRQSLGPLTDLFTERCRGYFSTQANLISFTGGFDGRTLLACALGQQLPVQTYSFGSHINPDVTIPRQISEKLNIPYHAFYLDETDYQDQFLPLGQDLILVCDGQSSWLHVHYLYSARRLQKKGALITGMFGSELLRALHVSGQVTARPLVDFFIHQGNPKVYRQKILASPRLTYLRLKYFHKELDMLWDKLEEQQRELKGLGLSENQRFYKFILEETFRKVFGSFIVPQLAYAPVRAPYLDWTFTRQLLQTELAGINNTFYTHNPLRRAKGQMFYARIIQQNHPPLLHYKNDKGYRPADLLGHLGILSITAGWLKKRLHRHLLPQDYDNLGILSGVKKNRRFFESLKIPDWMNAQKIWKMLHSTAWQGNILERDNLLRSLSLAWFITQEQNER